MSLEEYDLGIVQFGNDAPCLVKDKGSISLNGKSGVDDVYWVKGLKHNLLSVTQLNDKGLTLKFKGGICSIIGKSGELIPTGKYTIGNLFQLNAKIS